MYLFTIFTAFICIQLVTIASTDSQVVQPDFKTNAFFKLNKVAQDLDTSESSESDENDDYVRRTASFLRFGRSMPSMSGSFLRFGRGAPVGGTFLRFGRSIPSSSRFDRNGNTGGTFLRFGRQLHRPYPYNTARFTRQGEFLRFG